ncbi:hypothetical protein L579_1263 [Pantoea sp. AS-PWVM4]|nr:hypothetical protein L579_1263 [Pantoea sp. AS-PWVM4]
MKTRIFHTPTSLLYSTLLLSSLTLGSNAWAFVTAEPPHYKDK